MHHHAALRWEQRVQKREAGTHALDAAVPVSPMGVERWLEKAHSAA
jgi:hypothetical protein